MSERRANRLAGQTSPYLLQHAHNPVDWYPWGPEALLRSKQEDRPIFLSIGYSACHWCHVMERESFENEDIARFLNQHFVAIKVDREERPDLDDVYMKATQALSGHGGWPMSVFLTPELQPFHAGTYFPPVSRYGQPGFSQVLSSLARVWAEDRPRVREQAGRIAEVVKRLAEGELPAPAADARAPELASVDLAVEALSRAFDHEWGGFGGPPKFPHADDIRLLVRHHLDAGDHPALRMAEHTLDCMARGGIYDQLGGGFARYSTDEKWWVPHFEKMLYDNALLVPAYLEAWRVSRRPDFRRVVAQTCEFVLRELADPAGGFWSTLDADSEGEEGKYYAWTRADAHALLTREERRLVDVAYGLGDEPNFEGQHWVLVRPHPDAELARELGLADGEALHAALRPAREKLLAARAGRVRPGTDDKVLTAWNGLMIGALAQAGAALDEPRFVAAAQRAARFCLDVLRPDGRRLLATWRQGKAHLNGTLPDYAYFANGLLDLAEADGDLAWAREALALANVAREHFADAGRGGFWFTSDDHETLLARPKDLHDGATPSSNGVMVEVLVRLWQLTGDEALRAEAERSLALFEPALREHPPAFARALLALLRLGSGADLVVLAGGSGEEALARVLAQRRAGAVAVARVPPAGLAGDEARTFAALAGKPAVAGRAAAYVCRDATCSTPLSSPEELARQLA